ncbi:hypothetical protein [Methylobacterium sp. 10]|uniref:hypothetical protein n=1 Tax=Methylobacterium sp. 10 TaxID=1101191 RepID=UPI0004AE1C21|nr:hypothetical protein [Methylobacterium sp. 10]
MTATTMDAGEVDALEDAVAVATLCAERFRHPLAEAGARAVRDAIHKLLDDLYALERASLSEA